MAFSLLKAIVKLPHEEHYAEASWGTDRHAVVMFLV